MPNGIASQGNTDQEVGNGCNNHFPRDSKRRFSHDRLSLQLPSFSLGPLEPHDIVGLR